MYSGIRSPFKIFSVCPKTQQKNKLDKSYIFCCSFSGEKSAKRGFRQMLWVRTISPIASIPPGHSHLMRLGMTPSASCRELSVTSGLAYSRFFSPERSNNLFYPTLDLLLNWVFSSYAGWRFSFLLERTLYFLPSHFTHLCNLFSHFIWEGTDSQWIFRPCSSSLIRSQPPSG